MLLSRSLRSVIAHGPNQSRHRRNGHRRHRRGAAAGRAWRTGGAALRAAAGCWNRLSCATTKNRAACICPAACSRPIYGRSRTIRKSKSSRIWSAAWSRRAQIMLELLDKRQRRGHRQQSPARRAWAGIVRSRPGARFVHRLRSGRGRRHSDHRQHQPVPVGQSNSIAPRHFERHQQFHSHANGRAGGRLPTPPFKKPSDSAMPKPIRRSMSMAPTPPRSWPSSPIWHSARE